MTKEKEIIEDVELEILPAVRESEIDIQITTAKQYPRSITAFKRQALEMVTLDEETAGSMFYVLPRAGKMIEGPSVRLAEIVGSSWGNLRYAAKIVEITDKYITAEGVCYDLEKNVAASIQVSRRITNKEGRRYTDDMIQVTGNAACSIALRNAIFKVVPFAFIKEMYEEAKSVSIGADISIEEKRKKAIDSFKRDFKMKEADLLQILDKKGRDDLTIDDLIKLRGIYTALKEGDTTVDELLKPTEPDTITERLKIDSKTRTEKTVASTKKPGKSVTSDSEENSGQSHKDTELFSDSDVLSEIKIKIMGKMKELPIKQVQDALKEYKAPSVSAIADVDQAQAILDRLEGK